MLVLHPGPSNVTATAVSFDGIWTAWHQVSIAYEWHAVGLSFPPFLGGSLPMTKKSTKCALGLLTGGAIVAMAPTASAATQDCTALTNVVYIAGGSAAKPHLLAL